MKAKQKANWTNREAIVEELCCELAEWNIESVARTAKVAPATLYFWLDGTTRSPRIDTIARVAKAIGFELHLVRKQQQLRLVK